MKMYILKYGDYYLEDYSVEEVYDTDVRIFRWYLKDFKVSKEIKKLFYDFELAEDVRKLIYIETGLNLEIKRFKSSVEVDIEEDI
ncbi:MAG: hypothetical protein J6S85_04660 [Methanobrevibacter sp.]|nr:hypothetical protein [Methanobrevibacter sp.]